MSSIYVPRKIARNWSINKEGVLLSLYRYSDDNKIFKFCYQPDSGELLFDISHIHHYTMILNYGKKKFDDYIRGICFWDKKIVYLRGHENSECLKSTKKMVKENGIPRNFRVIWGKKAAMELEKDLVGL